MQQEAQVVCAVPGCGCNQPLQPGGRKSKANAQLHSATNPLASFAWSGAIPRVQLPRVSHSATRLRHLSSREAWPGGLVNTSSNPCGVWCSLLQSNVEYEYFRDQFVLSTKSAYKAGEQVGCTRFMHSSHVGLGCMPGGGTHVRAFGTRAQMPCRLACRPRCAVELSPTPRCRPC